ncbi:hypothetical protein SLPG_00022 [Salicola phage CGphi29]|uniref:hypothetical protein n=1 Tax=Salicola phage CGphi29 TaxID=754067 RepID=UPI0002C0F8D4|nr:hypothetical protein SLPG_00022 [Salicola phage CGphi29]AGH31816.1 hypothetical protein SLPG_00022 [Salicola phage CGphi29]
MPSAEIYGELQGVASELMAEFQQGTARYIHPGEQTGPDYDPQPGEPTPYTLDATVRGVAAQYVQEGYIAASDLQVTASVFGREPTLEGVVEIDGVEKQIIRVDPVPAAGTPVVWRIFVKG